MDSPNLSAAAMLTASNTTASPAPVAVEPAPTPTQATAFAELARFQNDPSLASKLVEGDPAVVRAYRQWQAAAFDGAPAPYAPNNAPTAQAANTQPPALLAGDQTEPNPFESSLTEPPASPSKYSFSHNNVVAVDHELENQFREVAYAARMPQHVAGSLALIWNRAAANPLPNPADVEAASLSNYRAMVDAMGEAQAREQLQLAQSVISALPEQQREWIADMLCATGLGNDPQVIRILADHARHSAKAKK